MKTTSAWTRTLLFLIVCLAAGSLAARAQEAAPKKDDLALAIADAQKANQAALAKYSWKVKTSLAKEGGAQATSVTEMRFNSEGKIDATTVSAESNVQKQPGLRGRAQENKMNEFAAYLEKVLKHSSQYIFMSKGTLVDVFDRAKVTPGEGSTEVVAGDLFVKGDVLNLSVDPASNLPQKLNFTTTLDKDTITGTVTFAKMEKGPNKPTKFEIKVPTQALTITSETYDWLEQK